MPTIIYDCTLQRDRVVVQETDGPLAGCLRIHDGEHYVRVRRPAGDTFELVIDGSSRHVYYMADRRLGAVPIHVGRRARIVEEEEA